MDSFSNSKAVGERRFTVQLGYPTWFATTIVVDAVTVAQACERAIDVANNQDGWRSLDDCGETFVERLAEGDDVDLWAGTTPTLPIPADYAEHAETEKLRGVISGLLRWAAMMGGFDAEIWRTAERTLGRKSSL